MAYWVAKYDGTTWTLLEDELFVQRSAHRSIVKGNVIYHIGGAWFDT